MTNNFNKMLAFIAMFLLAPVTAKAALETRVDASKADAPKTETKVKAPGYADFPDVPQNHWAYVAVSKLEHAQLTPSMSEGRPGTASPVLSRYEFAVATARALDKLANVAPPETLRFDRMSWTEIEHETVARIWLSQFDDSLHALQTEFADEIRRLSIRVDSMEERSLSISKASEPNRQATNHSRPNTTEIHSK